MDQLRALPFELAVLCLFMVVMARANATYWVGRVANAGGRRSRRLGDHLRGERMARAERLMVRFGVVAVPLSFLTIGVQTAVNFSAGLTRMPLQRYLPAVIVGSILWALLYASVGVVGIQSILVLMHRR